MCNLVGFVGVGCCWSVLRIILCHYVIVCCYDTTFALSSPCIKQLFCITEQTAQVKLPVVITKMGNFSFISTKNNSRAIAAMNFHPVTKMSFL